MAKKNNRQKLLRLLRRAHEAEDMHSFQGALVTMELSIDLNLSEVTDDLLLPVSNELAEAALLILASHAGPAQTVAPRLLEINKYWEEVLLEIKESTDIQVDEEVWCRVWDLVQPSECWQIDGGEDVWLLGFNIYQRLMDCGSLETPPDYEPDLGKITGVSQETFEKEILPLLDIVKMNAKFSFFVDFCPDDLLERRRREQIRDWFRNKPFWDGMETMMMSLARMSAWTKIAYLQTWQSFLKLDEISKAGAAMMSA